MEKDLRSIGGRELISTNAFPKIQHSLFLSAPKPFVVQLGEVKTSCCATGTSTKSCGVFFSPVCDAAIRHSFRLPAHPVACSEKTVLITGNTGKHPAAPFLTRRLVGDTGAAPPHMQQPLNRFLRITMNAVYI